MAISADDPHEQRIGIAFRPRDQGRSYHAGAAGSVLDDDRLPEFLADGLADGTRHDIARATRVIGNNDADGPGGIGFLRLRACRECS